MKSNPEKNCFFKSLPSDVIAACGILISGYLVILTAMEWPCLGGSRCDLVLRSDWGKLGPIPVAFFSLVAWSLLFFLPAWAQRTVLGLMLLGALAMVGIQIFVLRAFCLWCNLHHALVLFALLMPTGPRHPFFAVAALLAVPLLLLNQATDVRRALPSPDTVAHLQADSSALRWSGQADGFPTLLVLNLECPSCLVKLNQLADLLQSEPTRQPPQGIAWYFQSAPADIEWQSLFLAALFPLDEHPADAFPLNWPKLQPLIEAMDPGLWNDPDFADLMEPDFPHLKNHRSAWVEKLRQQQDFLQSHQLQATPLLVDEQGFTTQFSMESLFPLP